MNPLERGLRISTVVATLFLGSGCTDIDGHANARLQQVLSSPVPTRTVELPTQERPTETAVAAERNSLWEGVTKLHWIGCSEFAGCFVAGVGSIQNSGGFALAEIGIGSGEQGLISERRSLGTIGGEVAFGGSDEHGVSTLTALSYQRSEVKWGLSVIKLSPLAEPLSFNVFSFDRQIHDVSVSADGTHITYRGRDEKGEEQLFIALIEDPTKVKHAIPASVEGTTAWSTYNGMLAFTSEDENGVNQLFTLMFPTGKSDPSPVQITGEGSKFVPNWSPNGPRLAYFSQDIQGDEQLMILELNSISSPRTLVEGMKFEGTIGWSPDGRRIVFSALDKFGHAQLYSMQVYGDGSFQQLTDFSDGNAVHPEISPDGKTTAFIFEGDDGQAKLGVVDVGGE